VADAVAAAGLRYVSDVEPGIRRKPAGRGFSYSLPDGARLTDPAEMDRIRGLAIPPAWTDVWICTSADGHIQATGRDAKGRKQYRYNVRYRAVRDETKFDRLLDFSLVLPKIRRRVERDIGQPGLPREKMLATVVRLLEKTLIRVGSDVYTRENRSFGLTTLRRRHVEVAGSRLRFEFRGKSGVMRSVAITDRRLASIIQHCQTLPGQELFKYLDGRGRRQRVDSGDINGYLRRITRQDITAKDFRTWAGTISAATKLREIGRAKSDYQARRNVNIAIDHVAERLGNTRAVCRKYYVHPAIIRAYLEGIVLEDTGPRARKRGGTPPGLRRDEVAVLEFLHSLKER
jgi:DNA topoisomerase-1